MKKYIFLTLIVTALIFTSCAGTAPSDTDKEPSDTMFIINTVPCDVETEFKYSELSDLVYHALAHMKVNNASDLYSEDYINSVNRPELLSDMTALSEYYGANFNRLNLVNSPVGENTAEFKERLLNSGIFTDADKTEFIEPFISALDRENESYSSLWQTKHEENSEKRAEVEDFIKSELRKYGRVFKYHNKTASVGLSYNMTRNGRGMYSDDAFSAVVPFPETEKELKYTFFMLLHEYTHQITDAILEADINMDDGSHSLSEDVVMVFDLYLIKTFSKADVPLYFRWISEKYGAGFASEEAFLSAYEIPSEINDKLIELIVVEYTR